MFFLPVDGNMNRHNMLGEKLPGYEWLVQSFRVLSSERAARRTVHGGFSSVTVTPSGQPVTLSLSSVKYDKLVESISGWSAGEIVLEVVPSWRSVLLPATI